MSIMTPILYYQKKCQDGLLVRDQQQLDVLTHLQTIYHELIREHKKRTSIRRHFRNPVVVKGLYVWGGVGIGKTSLMDCFYECVPFKEKMRMHFHAFMRMIHLELKKHQGGKNPIKQIANHIAKKAMLLCFDELIVNDIADAMILARLFEALFENGVCIVTTSNTKPDDLYRRGLQRPLFLPAIELLKQHTQVMHLMSETDYRLRHFKQAGVFYMPDDVAAENKMAAAFTMLAGHLPISDDPIDICERKIMVKQVAGEVVWFDFDVICKPPRSQHDYLAITQEYKIVFISHIPVIPSNAKDLISLFIRLVDVFYDAKIKLVLSSAVPVEQIYTDGIFTNDFKRTCSRLIEMQSEAYFHESITHGPSS